MTEDKLAAIKRLFANCEPHQSDALLKGVLEELTSRQLRTLFEELRKTHTIHELEERLNARAEMILAAIDNAPEMTLRMLRGVIADAAFLEYMIPDLLAFGWTNVKLKKNLPYDYLVKDAVGELKVQVKLQRSKLQEPEVRRGARYGFNGNVYVTETQKSRNGLDKNDEKTRFYRYDEFDILAVSMYPSTGEWNVFKYTVGNWLMSGTTGRIAVFQPVAKENNEFWTNDFNEVAQWFREHKNTRRISIVSKPQVAGVRKSPSLASAKKTKTSDGLR